MVNGGRYGKSCTRRDIINWLSGYHLDCNTFNRKKEEIMFNKNERVKELEKELASVKSDLAYYKVVEDGHDYWREAWVGQCNKAEELERLHKEDVQNIEALNKDIIQLTLDRNNLKLQNAALRSSGLVANKKKIDTLNHRVECLVDQLEKDAHTINDLTVRNDEFKRVMQMVWKILDDDMDFCDFDAYFGRQMFDGELLRIKLSKMCKEDDD